MNTLIFLESSLMSNKRLKDNKQKKRLNENLLENGIEPLSEEGFDNLRLAFYEKALDMELPF